MRQRVSSLTKIYVEEAKGVSNPGSAVLVALSEPPLKLGSGSDSHSSTS